MGEKGKDTMKQNLLDYVKDSTASSDMKTKLH